MYEEKVKRLREYAAARKGEIAELTADAADAIEELSKPQNTVHLCTSCKYQYPECPADTGVVFGRGKGNDNICQCADYVARYPRWIPVTERLPETRTRCVTISRDGDYGLGVYTTDYGWMFPYYMGETTHWMPLPELPKEES